MSWSKLIKEINSDTGYILAVSGGIDSMVLLDFFNRCCKTQIKVVHFNHHIRNTNDDENIVRSYCYDNDLELYICHGTNLKNIKNQENEARHQRWIFFEKIAKLFNYKYIVTAHHLNDSVENFILQIMRGNNITSCTMKKHNTVNGVIRYKPFLDFDKNTLLQSAKRYGVTWNDDITNFDETYLRNYIRHSIIPMMMKDRNVLKTIPKTIKSVLSLTGEE